MEALNADDEIRLLTMACAVSHDQTYTPLCLMNPLRRLSWLHHSQGHNGPKGSLVGGRPQGHVVSRVCVCVCVCVFIYIM